MEKTCFLFSGQGSQYPEMGKELLENLPELNRIFEAGSDILKFDLKNACFTYDAKKLSQTEIAQPAIMAVSLISYEAVKKLGIYPDMAAGHSLGEYAAITAAGMLTPENAFRVIKARAAAMGRCANKHPGTMCAVIGLSGEEITSVCEKINGYVIPVNFNSPKQTVIAGENAAVEEAITKFSNIGKRCIKLAVSAAFHSKLMEEAAIEFKQAIKDIPFKSPKFDFYSNTTGEKLDDHSNMPEYLARHLISPVRFTDELNAIHKAKATRFIECGPGKVLTGLVRRTLDDISVYHVENSKTLKVLKEAL